MCRPPAQLAEPAATEPSGYRTGAWYLGSFDRPSDCGINVEIPTLQAPCQQRVATGLFPFLEWRRIERLSRVDSKTCGFPFLNTTLKINAADRVPQSCPLSRPAYFASPLRLFHHHDAKFSIPRLRGIRCPSASLRWSRDLLATERACERSGNLRPAAESSGQCYMCLFLRCSKSGRPSIARLCPSRLSIPVARTLPRLPS